MIILKRFTLLFAKIEMNIKLVLHLVLRHRANDINHYYICLSEIAERNSMKLNRKQDINDVLYQVCVFQANQKNKMAAQPLIGWGIFNFFSETAEQNSTKLDRKQDLNVLYQVCVFLVDRKNKIAAPASDWLRHFRLFLWNRWTEFNETWQGARSQLVFRANPKYKIAALASD